MLIAKYKEAQGSIKGLQGKVQELEEQKSSSAADNTGGAEGGADPAFGATIAALQTQLREVTQAKDEAVRRAEAEAAAAAAAAATYSGKGVSSDGEGAEDDADFGATIAALQAQLREVTQEKDEAVKTAAAATAAAAVQKGNGEGAAGGIAMGEEGAAAVAAAKEQLEAQDRAHQEALAEKQSQNEQLVQKVRQLLATCRSLKEQVAETAPAPAQPYGDNSTATATNDTQDLQAQLDIKQSENEKLLARLRELAQRYRALQQQQQQEQQDKEAGEGGAASTTPMIPADIAERLAAAERQVAHTDKNSAELTRRCEEAEMKHQRATESLKEALERLAALEATTNASAAASAAAATADQEKFFLQEEKLRAKSMALEERVAGLVAELQTSREEKEEFSTQLEAKTVGFEKMVCGGFRLFFVYCWLVCGLFVVFCTIVMFFALSWVGLR